MKYPLILFLFELLFFNSNLLRAQTGPAGVGTSANNVLWLKADAGTNTFVNGAAVTYWNDQSGNMNSVYQNTVIQQPVYSTNVINGFPAIEFDNNTTTNDKMLGYDSPTLDNTAGYSFFTVSRPQVVDGNARVILSKRTTISVDQSFMLFYYTSNKFHVDIQTVNDRYPTVTGFSANNNYLIDMFYDGTQPMASRCKTYVGEFLDVTAPETNASVPDNASPLIIGSTDATDGRPFGGYISEILIYRNAVNDAQRIIVNNYLSAKYNIPLTTNDKYAGDNTVNGDYDREVAGVGKESSGSNNAFASSVAAGLGITVNSGLDIDDYILAGHASPANSQMTTDVGGMTGASNARWQRIWYFDVTNTSTNINTNIEFDMSDGIGPFTVPLGTVSDYVLLYRAAQTGNWTELTTASTITGDKVHFNNYTLTLDGYYTIGTHNYLVSPLPIELLNFNAILNSNKVDLTWTTASETNNDYFTVERAADGVNFEPVLEVRGAGTAVGNIDYMDVDNDPLKGLSYYRLKQTDFNGHSTYSGLVPVNYNADESVTVYPNPLSRDASLNMDVTGLKGKQLLVVVRDMQGKEYYSEVKIISENKELTAVDLQQRLIPGTYIIIATSDNKAYSQKLVIQ